MGDEKTFEQVLLKLLDICEERIHIELRHTSSTKINLRPKCES